jgi:hypothetical protein
VTDKNELLERIYAALTEAFSPGELRGLVYSKLGVDRNDLPTGEGESPRVQIDAIGEYVKRRGDLTRLVVEARIERLRSRDLAALGNAEAIARVLGEDDSLFVEAPLAAVQSAPRPAAGVGAAATPSTGQALLGALQPDLSSTAAEAHGSGDSEPAAAGRSSGDDSSAIARSANGSPSVTNALAAASGLGGSDPFTLETIAVEDTRSTLKAMNDHVRGVLVAHTDELEQLSALGVLPDLDTIPASIQLHVVQLRVSSEPLADFARILWLATSGARRAEQVHDYQLVIEIANATAPAYEILAEMVAASDQPMIDGVRVSELIRHLKTYWSMRVALAEYDKRCAIRLQLVRAPGAAG